MHAASPDRLLGHRQDRSALLLLGGLVAFKVLLHLVTNAVSPYGLHRDELLYLALGDHPAWGYREVPPLVPLLGHVARAALGTSLVAVRLIPALVGGALVLLTGLMARTLGGGRFAMLLAALAVFVGPVFLRANTLFQPVAFDQLVWALAAYALALRIERDDPRLWIAVGAVLGVGLLVKFTAAFFGLGLLVGVVLTARRRDLATPWPWLGALVALVLASPNLVWQVQHGWPFFEHMGALAEQQLVHVSRVDFLAEQVLIVNPLTLPIWLAGLAWLFSRRGAPYRALGWAYVVVLSLLLISRGKAYYLAPAYPMLFAAGSVALAGFVRARWARSATVAVLVAGGVAMVPLALPVLSPEATADYAVAAGATSAVRDETGHVERLPQDFADMLGWPEQVATVAQVFGRLPVRERASAVVLAGNYGEAGAVDVYGGRYGLPPATSYASSYYDWGTGNRPGAVAVAVGVPDEVLHQLYSACRSEAVVRHPWVVRYETELPVQVCRGLRRPLALAWPDLKRYQ